jgi:hypothetical protein
VWSGIKGFSVSGVFRDLISGKQPANLQQTTPVTAGGLFGGLFTSLLSAQGGGSPGNVKLLGQSTGSGWSPQDRMTFARSLLATIGAPQSQANINSILGWINHEGGGGTNNPLNTTQTMPGSTNFNNLGGGTGVQNYTSMAIGVAANAKTLMGSAYSQIVADLRSGQGLCGKSYAGLSTWSGGGYSSVC